MASFTVMIDKCVWYIPGGICNGVLIFEAWIFLAAEIEPFFPFREVSSTALRRQT
jgi:hypothetical protein